VTTRPRTEATSLRWVVTFQGRREVDRLTYRVVLCDHSHDMEKVPSNAVEFAEWFTGMLNLIPVEHRSDAVVDTSEDGDECYSRHARFRLYVDRLETDQEHQIRMVKIHERLKRESDKRAEAAARKAEEAERHDIEEFERLKKKFGA
jgi:hypothetical protein